MTGSGLIIMPYDEGLGLSTAAAVIAAIAAAAYGG